jgi:hypothetical protein
MSIGRRIRLLGIAVIDAMLRRSPGNYPYLEREDVLEASRYAAWRASEREIDLASN